MSVFIRMLYSCLVDADFLDTEAFMSRGKKVRNSGEPVGVLLEIGKACFRMAEKSGHGYSKWKENRNFKALFRRRKI